MKMNRNIFFISTITKKIQVILLLFAIFQTQWDTFNGKCGVCGDPYDAPHPQDNENTGLYGKFGPIETYKAGAVVNVTILLTSNHNGVFTYR